MGLMTLPTEGRTNFLRDFFGGTDRRHFCRSTVGLGIAGVLAKLPLTGKQKFKMTAEGQGFLIVNGWVLTCEDVAASGMTLDVV